MGILPPGKLPAALLGSLLGSLTQPAEVIVGPGIGHDVAVLETGGPEYLVAKTDPITFATEALGHYLVAVNVNDLATSGGIPRWLLVTLLLPEGQTTEAVVRELWQQLTEACEAVGVSIIGGHTEITCDLSRPLAVGLLLGTVPRDQLIAPGGTRPGDVILLTKGLPLEGTALIARERREQLLAAGYEAAWLDRCANLLYQPGLSVLPEARALCQALRPHALHDPTEGGVATALWELAEASGVGLLIEARQLPVLPEGQTLCAEFGLDPLGTIASGSLLAAVRPDDEAAALAACQAAGIACQPIGRATPAADGVLLREQTTCRPLPRFDQDEITRLFAGAAG
jgi:hydrogenase expression/formation protein HypE